MAEATDHRLSAPVEKPPAVSLGAAMGRLGCFSAGSGFAAGIALFTLAVHRPARVVAPVAALSLVTIPVYDVAATGYPTRMREWTARRKAAGDIGVPGLQGPD